MIRTTFLFSALISCFIWVRHAYAQQQAYDSLVTLTFGFYEIKESKASAEKYAEAFAVLGGKGFFIRSL